VERASYEVPASRVQFRGPVYHFVTSWFLYGELSASLPTPKLENHPLSAVRDRLFNIYSLLPSMSGGCLLHPQPEDAPCRGVLFHVFYFCCILFSLKRVMTSWLGVTTFHSSWLQA